MVVLYGVVGPELTDHTTALLFSVLGLSQRPASTQLKAQTNNLHVHHAEDAYYMCILYVYTLVKRSDRVTV
jgi:hypothetical protein